MRISVIIPTHNRAEMLCRCVESVLTCDWDDVEVVVADDCSTDDTAARVQARFGADGRVKYARTPCNSFAAAARNCGARVATGRYLLFLDDDNELEGGGGVLRELVACFNRHPGVEFVAPLAIHWRTDPTRRRVWSLGTDYNPWTTLPRNYQPANLPLGELPPGDDWPTTYSPNAFMVTREAFDRVDGFDEGYGIQYEEADFGFKVTRTSAEVWRGRPVGYICARARTRHFGYLDPSEVGVLRGLGLSNPRRAYCFGRNRAKFARRHFTFLQALVSVFVFVPLSAAYYGCVALRHRRADIAWGYVRGAIAGMLGLYTTRTYTAA